MDVKAIQQEIDRLTTEIDEWEKQRAAIEEKINPAKRERESWQFILGRRGGNEAAENDRPTATPASTVRSEVMDEYGAKSRVMRQHILGSVELGVTPRSVIEFMQSQGMSVSPNFVYKTLAKMRDDGEIRNTGGVYRPAVR